MYKPEDVDLLVDLLNKAEIPADGAWCLFVIGHYTVDLYHDNYSSPGLKKSTHGSQLKHLRGLVFGDTRDFIYQMKRE